MIVPETFSITSFDASMSSELRVPTMSPEAAFMPLFIAS